ncbi:MAG: FYVE zinc finger domain-containing protein [archaeon]|nr:FYVE zinc finger domain-containing protein [archaeon]
MSFLQQYLKDNALVVYVPEQAGGEQEDQWVMMPSLQENTGYRLPEQFASIFPSGEDVFSLLIAADWMSLPLLKSRVQQHIALALRSKNLIDVRSYFCINHEPLERDSFWHQIKSSTPQLWTTFAPPPHYEHSSHSCYYENCNTPAALCTQPSISSDLITRDHVFSPSSSSSPSFSPLFPIHPLPPAVSAPEDPSMVLINSDDAVLPTQPVANEKRTSCKECRAQFVASAIWGTGKHHCRCCGDIFCHNCSNNWVPESWIPLPIQIPKGWLEFQTTILFSGSSLRVCNKCKATLDYEKDGSLCILTKGFAILTLDYFLLNRARLLSPLWYRAASQSINTLRSLQHISWHVPLSDYQKEFLWNNRRAFVGHPRWMLQVARSVDSTNPADLRELCQLLKHGTRFLSCAKLRCSPLHCTNDPLSLVSDHLPLLQSWMPDTEIRCLAVAKVRRLLSDQQIGFILPLLFQLMLQEPSQNDILRSPLVAFLFDHATHHLDFRFRLYWHLTLVKNSPRAKAMQRARHLSDFYVVHLTKHLGEDAAVALIQSAHLANIFQTIPPFTPEESARSILALELRSFSSSSIPTPLLVDPAEEILSFQLDRLRVKNSATKPIVVPVNLLSSPRQPIMCFKFEDVRKDQLMLLMIRLFSDIVGRAFPSFSCQTCPASSPCAVLTHWEPPVTYNVLPTTEDAGFLEFVPCSTTLKDIRDGKESLQNWLIRNSALSEGDYVGVVRPRFIRSMAFWTVTCCLLGLGDRHTDNIMILPNGQLFHIDFGFILGDDPKILMPLIRLTPDMVECMGNHSSPAYAHFKELSTSIYLELRRYYPLFSQVLATLSDLDPPITEKSVTAVHLHSHLHDRFLPLESSDGAKDKFHQWVESSWASAAHILNDYLRSVTR